MPDALKIFIASMLAGLLGAVFTSKVGLWLVERFFPREPMALGIVFLATALVALGSAVTTGVLIGRARKT